MVSIKYKNKEKIKTVTRTTMVVPYTSFREGHTTFFISAFTSDKNLFIFANNISPLMFHKKKLQAWQDSFSLNKPDVSRFLFSKIFA
jgi:hypothetical protein